MRKKVHQITIHRDFKKYAFGLGTSVGMDICILLIPSLLATTRQILDGNRIICRQTNSQSRTSQLVKMTDLKFAIITIYVICSILQY